MFNGSIIFHPFAKPKECFAQSLLTVFFKYWLLLIDPRILIKCECGFNVGGRSLKTSASSIDIQYCATSKTKSLRIPWSINHSQFLKMFSNIFGDFAANSAIRTFSSLICCSFWSLEIPRSSKFFVSIDITIVESEILFSSIISAATADSLFASLCMISGPRSYLSQKLKFN